VIVCSPGFVKFFLVPTTTGDVESRQQPEYIADGFLTGKREEMSKKDHVWIALIIKCNKGLGEYFCILFFCFIWKFQKADYLCGRF